MRFRNLISVFNSAEKLKGDLVDKEKQRKYSADAAKRKVGHVSLPWCLLALENKFLYVSQKQPYSVH